MQKKNSLQQAIAISRIAGCQFTEEEMDDYQKIERGELTFEDVERKLLSKLRVLKQQHPEYFAHPNSK